MRTIQFLIILLFCIVVSAQDFSKINLDLKLTDSLTHKTEIRIYQDYGITNYTSLFRMFKNEKEKWTAEFYMHYAKVTGKVELRTEKRNLESESDMEFIYQNLLRSHILDLPSLTEIQWKLITRGDVEKVSRQVRGKVIEEYQSTGERIDILDGKGYTFQIKSWKSNEFSFSNPESYLKHYPDVDELIYICEILDLIKSEFHIWEK